MTAGQKTLLVLGGTSDIGHAVALAYAAAGWSVILASRDAERARRNADDIEARHGSIVASMQIDILETECFADFISGVPVLPDTVICVIGLLGDEHRARSDPGHAAAILRSNFEGPALLLSIFANLFAARGSGTIVGISSVAGDRGRGSNTAYGSAKAGFTAYLSGIRNRLAESGVRVVTVKPGFVRTRMTSDMALPALLTAEPGEVGRAVFAAADGRRRRDVIYVRGGWRWIMLAIRLMPEFVFKRLKL